MKEFEMIRLAKTRSTPALIPGQTIATCQRNIVGHNILRAFGRRVVMLKFENGQIWANNT